MAQDNPTDGSAVAHTPQPRLEAHSGIVELGHVDIPDNATAPYSDAHMSDTNTALIVEMLRQQNEAFSKRFDDVKGDTLDIRASLKVLNGRLAKGELEIAELKLKQAATDKNYANLTKRFYGAISAVIVAVLGGLVKRFIG